MEKQNVYRIDRKPGDKYVITLPAGTPRGEAERIVKSFAEFVNNTDGVVFSISENVTIAILSKNKDD